MCLQHGVLYYVVENAMVCNQLTLCVKVDSTFFLSEINLEKPSRRSIYHENN